MSLQSSQSPFLTLSAAVLAAIGASVCCVVPLALLLLGVSGAWIGNLTALDPWRPWFTAATLLCLGWAAWSFYGPASRCRTDGTCVDRSVLRRRRAVFWVAVAVIGLLLLFPYYAVWLV